MIPKFVQAAATRGMLTSRAMATRLKVIVFTDRVGSSIAATDIGDASRARVNQAQELITRETAAETRGLVIKFLGDGHLLTFDSASDAIRAGHRIQTRIAEYNAGANEPLRFHLRIGVDVGDVDVDTKGDVRGHAADMARRVEGAGEADEVIFTDRVFAVLPPRLAQHSVIKTEQLKGDDRPTTLHRLIGLADEGPRTFRNPFIVGGPILNPRDFFGRKRAFNFSMTRLRSMQSISIVGDRRIGKSSLLRCILGLLSEDLGPAYRAACIDLVHPLAHTIPGVLGEIQRQLGLASSVITLPEFCERLTEMYRAGIRAVVGLDDLEMLIRAREEFSRDFCEALRSVAQLGQVALITTSRSNLRELHDAGALVSPLHNIMGVLHLEELPEDEARDLVTASRSGVRFTTEHVDSILSRGCGHPLRLQILCWHAAQASLEGATDWRRVWTEAEAEIAYILGN